jgi:hypothetical protein
MNTSGITVQEYRSQLGEHTELALKYSGDLSDNKLQGFSMKDPVATTLSLSIDWIVYNNSLTADYLFLVICVERRDISLNLLDAASPQVREGAIRILRNYALITRRPAKSALNVHQLVHQALRKRLQVQRQIRQ